MSETKIDPNDLTEQQLEDLLQQKRNKTAQERQAYKDLVSETVPEAVTQLIDISRQLTVVKALTFNYFKSVLSLKASVFNMDKARWNAQQSHTFSTDKYGITIGYRVNDGWDDTVHDGVAKVTVFLESLAKDDDSARLVRTIFRLLKEDSKGNLRASRVLELQQLAKEFNNAQFDDGVKMITDAYRPVRTCWFIEAYYVDPTGAKVTIPLSMSTVDFPADFDFSFMIDDEAA